MDRFNPHIPPKSQKISSHSSGAVRYTCAFFTHCCIPMPLSDTLAERLARLQGAPENTDRPRIVIDTNVLLDLLFWHDASAEPLRRALETGTVAAVFDDEALKEAAEVLGRPKFLAGDEEAVFTLLEAWSRNAQRVPDEAVSASAKTLTVRCRDPLDQKFLVLARAAGASWLATKDKLLFKAGKKLRRFGVEPIRPADFALLLRERPNGGEAPRP